MVAKYGDIVNPDVAGGKGVWADADSSSNEKAKKIPGYYFQIS